LEKQTRIDALVALGAELSNLHQDPEWADILQLTQAENGWFTPDHVHQAVSAIATTMLTREHLTAWLGQYPWVAGPTDRSVALVMAGNIPLVGFHDWLCVFASGHRAKVKLSDKDRVLLPFLVRKLGDIAFESWAFTEFAVEYEPLRQFDAVIATGSDNSARYFHQYFGKYPHIIRKNRNSIAVLDGTETKADLLALGKDIFNYFGLGCRNVSKLYVPFGYSFEFLLETLHEYRDLVQHNKYLNNFDYNFTLFVLNNIPYMNNGCILLKEDDALTARIATLHYAYYQDLNDLSEKIAQQKDNIQCGVGHLILPDFPLLPFGTTQAPGLTDYADGVDVMRFLSAIPGGDKV
jgi:hypothetical protein